MKTKNLLNEGLGIGPNPQSPIPNIYISKKYNFLL